MSKSPPAFQFYPADFVTATAEWSNAEVGAYIRLLIHQWINGDVPLDQAAAVRLCGGEPEGVAKALTKFAPVEGSNGHRRGTNPRLERVRKDAESFRRLQAEKGAKSAATRERKPDGRFS